jgi:hypothetical protein
MLPSSSSSRIGLLALVFGVSACGSRGIRGGGTAQGGGAGGVVSDAGAAAGGSVGSGGEASGGIIAGGAAGETTGGATGGAPATGGSATTGGAISTGGVPAAGGASGTSAMTLAEACTRNCALASGLPTCSTTTTECEQNCMTTYDNTSAVNSDLGRMYTEMMVCVATNPKFASSADFVCAKPNYPLNKWSPGPDSDCEQLICDWNCNDVTFGTMDPWVFFRCFACGP